MNIGKTWCQFRISVFFYTQLHNKEDGSKSKLHFTYKNIYYQIKKIVNTISPFLDSVSNRSYFKSCFTFIITLVNMNLKYCSLTQKRHINHIAIYCTGY